MSERIILLYGGNSQEHEISLRSAASILRNLNPEKYQVIPVGIDKAGCFHLNTYEACFEHEESLPVKAKGSTPLATLFQNGECVLKADVVFPALHGPLYEDGAIQGFLEQIGLPYVGSGVLASAIGMNKDVSRRLVCDDMISSAPYRVLSCHQTSSIEDAFCDEVIKSFGWPLFVKPCTLGSSVGVHRVTNREALIEAIHDAFRYDTTILVEKAVTGREIELAVLQNISFSKSPIVSIPGEIVVEHPDGFYSYRAKYLDSDKTRLCIPAVLQEETVKKLQEMCRLIFTRIGCAGMARVDFFVNDDTGEIYFNEINTLPGFTSISMYPKLMEASGIPYGLLLEKLIDLAILQGKLNKARVTSYE